MRQAAPASTPCISFVGHGAHLGRPQDAVLERVPALKNLPQGARRRFIAGGHLEHGVVPVGVKGLPDLAELCGGAGRRMRWWAHRRRFRGHAPW